MAMRLLVVLLLLSPLTTLCQEGENEFGKYKINKNFCVRGEVGWHKSWFTSLGASYVFSSVNNHTPFHVVLYGAMEADLANYRSPNAFYAYKAGIESGSLIYAYGLELRNNTDFSGNNHLVFTPKLGLSFFGHANLMYGYNIFRTANNFFGINHSQISLSVNLNRKMFKESFVPGASQ